MMVKIVWSFVFLWLLLLSDISAQPDILPYGCHFVKNQAHRSRLPTNGREPQFAGNGRSDTLDVLHTDIYLDLTGFAQQTIRAVCSVRFASKLNNIDVLPLDLTGLTVDSVRMEGQGLNYDWTDPLLQVFLPQPLNTGDTAEVEVFYQGHPLADPSGFGGFDFDGNICYNLGIGFSADPLPVGRTWFPCFDNFVERSTYDIRTLTHGGRRGFAIGTFIEEILMGGDTLLRHYRMDQSLPTYLVGVAASNYTISHSTHEAVNGPIPIELIGAAGDTTQMKFAFSQLGASIDVLEDWYGPYFWERVGYILTPAGAMEHCTSIHYPGFVIDQGPDFGQNKLMAHELAHHWWGNITTLTTPSNMWIKEGNAEYGAHLFFEHVYGKEEFREVVKDNHFNVIRKAHVDDGGIFHPLSPMPFEFTYGTHTYNKGAAVMHTLRGYMGDTLFSQGMRSILEQFPYQSVDAEQFRDQLISHTGLTYLHDFFDDWIFSPGFAAYELDSLQLTPAGGGQFTARLFIQQKRYAAPHFHTQVPLEITFYDENWNTFDATVTVTGEFSEPEVVLPFQPVYQMVNDNNKLNLGQLSNRTRVYEANDDINGEHASISNFKVISTPDSALVFVTHFYGPPDPASENAGFRISNSHYWNVGGILPAGLKMKANLEYRGAGALDLDHDLTSQSEDSLILVYRPDAATPWAPYPWYAKLTFSPDNGFGFIRIDTLYAGDYAFANDLDLSTGIVTAQPSLSLAVFPNPADEYLILEGEVPISEALTAVVSDAAGRIMEKRRLLPDQQLLHAFFVVKNLSPGTYHLQVFSESGNYRETFSFVVE